MRRRPKRSSGVCVPGPRRRRVHPRRKVSAWFSSVPIQRRPVLFCIEMSWRMSGRGRGRGPRRGRCSFSDWAPASDEEPRPTGRAERTIDGNSSLKNLWRVPRTRASTRSSSPGSAEERALQGRDRRGGLLDRGRGDRFGLFDRFGCLHRFGCDDRLGCCDEASRPRPPAAAIGRSPRGSFRGGPPAGNGLVKYSLIPSRSTNLEPTVSPFDVTRMIGVSFRFAVSL